MKIDPDAGESLYLQLVRQIRDQIISGELPLGEPIPSARTVLAEFGIGRNTYSRAVGELRRQGLVAIRPGQGVYVICRPELRVVGLHPGDRVTVRMPDDQERERLGTGHLTPLLVITRADGAREVYSGAITVGEVPGPEEGREPPSLG